MKNPYYEFSGGVTNHKCDQCAAEKPDAILRDVKEAQLRGFKNNPPMLCVACVSQLPERAWMRGE